MNITALSIQMITALSQSSDHVQLELYSLTTLNILLDLKDTTWAKSTWKLEHRDRLEEKIKKFLKSTA